MGLLDRVENVLTHSEDLIHFFKMSAGGFGEKEVDACQSLAIFEDGPGSIIGHPPWRRY